MKKVFNILFDGKWGSLLLMQALFFGGLLLGAENAPTGLRVASGIVWFGSFVLWMFAQQNSWSKK